MNYELIKEDFKYYVEKEISGMLNAQSYLKVGYAVQTIQDADIVVLERVKR